MANGMLMASGPQQKPHFVDSLLLYPASCLAEASLKAIPSLNVHGLGPDLVDGVKDGTIVMANAEKHRHGKNIGGEVSIFVPGIQNLYSVANFARGSSMVTSLYTFRMHGSALETPIELETPGRPMSTTYLAEVGRNSMGKEAAVATAVLGSAQRHINDEFVTAGCLQELTNYDEKKAPEPSYAQNQSALHDVWLIGQTGKRTTVAQTKEGEIIRYQRPGPLDPFLTYLKTDLRYTAREFPLDAFGIEDLEDFWGSTKQLILTRLLEGAFATEKGDYSPRRKDGYTNPVTPFLRQGMI